LGSRYAMPRGVAAALRRSALALRPADVAQQVPKGILAEAVHEVPVAPAHLSQAPEFNRYAAAAWQPFGQALQRYLATGSTQDAEQLLFWSDLQPNNPDVLPAGFFFRSRSDMPPLERKALELCRLHGGRVLDIGAGAGSHALALAEMGVEVDTVDACPEAVEVMQTRGLSARCCSMWRLGHLDKYTTILLLMNSAGAVGSITSLRDFLSRVYESSAPNCRVLLDTCPPDWDTIRSAAKRRVAPLPRTSFLESEYAVLRCRLSLGAQSGPEFPLLFTEPRAVAAVAAAVGWRTGLAYEDEDTRHALLQLEKMPQEEAPTVELGSDRTRRRKVGAIDT